MDDDITALTKAVRHLEDRVAGLEAQGSASLPARAPEPGQRADLAGPAEAPDTFWALDGLRARRPAHPVTVDGSVMLLGSVTLPDGTPVEWQQEAGTSGLLEVDWADRAAAFAALGHSVRVELLRHVLAGTHTTAALAEVESLGTTGQLHHHLRQLLTAGWLRQAGRGTYEVPAARVVPLLVCLTAVER